MTACCSILAWRIPWTEEPGGLQSMQLQGVGHGGAMEHTHRGGNMNLALLDTKAHWWKYRSWNGKEGHLEVLLGSAAELAGEGNMGPMAWGAGSFFF